MKDHDQGSFALLSRMISEEQQTAIFVCLERVMLIKGMLVEERYIGVDISLG